MAKVTEVRRVAHPDQGVWFDVEWIGEVLIYKFSPGYDHGLFDSRPWHICSFGHNFPTLEDAVTFLRAMKAPTDDDGGRYNPSSECEGIYLGRE